MKTRLEVLTIQWLDNDELSLNFKYDGDLPFVSSDMGKASNKEVCRRLNYHLSKYRSLVDKDIAKYDKYKDKWAGSLIMLCFRLGSVRNLADTIIPSEYEEAVALSDRIDRIGELTDAEFQTLVDDLIDFSYKCGHAGDKTEQFPKNLRELPDAFITRSQKLGVFE